MRSMPLPIVEVQTRCLFGLRNVPNNDAPQHQTNDDVSDGRECPIPPLCLGLDPWHSN